MPEQLKYVTYDLETLVNCITACFYDHTTKKKKEFVLFDRYEEFEGLVKFLRQLKKNNYILVGINTVAFDGQIIQFILNNADVWAGIPIDLIVTNIYNHSQYIIHLEEREKWEALVPEYKFHIPQLDLFKQKHYDGKAKQGTSLKWLQFTMRYPTVEEMPISHDTRVEGDQILSILAYNWNDVASTATFFERNRFETELRLELSEKYQLNLLNASEPRLAKQIFAKFLCEEMNIDYKDLKDMRTFRKDIHLKDIIFKYIKFKTPELQAVLDRVRKTSVNPNVKDKFELEFKYGGIDTVMGLGGIHACCKPGVYEASDKWVLHDIDVVSFYPNLAIVNDIRPQHLGPVFNKVYKRIFDERQLIPKKDPINYVYKIILNSTYGLSKEINTYLYDPRFTYAITINGQLSLLMLVEHLVSSIPGIRIYQENTDGVTIGYDSIHKSAVADICVHWANLTKLNLEHAYYQKMVIRDVNNYMAIKEGFDWTEYQEHVKAGKKRVDYGKIKHKGCFDLELDYHKNPSFLVIPMAAEAYFFGALSYKDYINNHNNIYDFLAGVKRKSNFDLNWHVLHGGKHQKIKQQKVTRFFVSNAGGMMTKDFNDGRRVAVLADWTVEPLNVVKDEAANAYSSLNRIYYIKEAEKLITSVEGNSNQLTLW